MMNSVGDSMKYQNLDTEIKHAMRRSAKDAVILGYLLRRMMEERLWTECYGCFDDYLREELHMDYTMASRFIGINKKYSVDGDSMTLAAQWHDFSQAALIEMLSMPAGLEAKVTPDMTVRQIREVKRQAKEEKAKARKEAEPAKAIRCGYYPEHTCGIKETIKKHFTKGGNVEGCAGCCAVCMERVECKYTCEAVLAQGVIKPADTPGERLPGQMLIQDAQETEAGDPPGDEILDAEYRELDVVEEVATSQPKKSAYGLTKSEYPEGSLIAIEGCGNKYNCFSCAQDCGIRQKYRYCTIAPLGNPFGCETMGILESLKSGAGDRCQFVNHDLASHKAGSGEADPCCRDCSESCQYRCGKSCQDSVTGTGEAGDGNLSGDEILDADYRELETVEQVATSQCPELVRPDKKQSRYLDDFAKHFIHFKWDWLLDDFSNRVSDVTKSPEEIKNHLGENARTWYFASGKDSVAHINLFDGYVQLWDGAGNYMGDFDWSYLAAALQRMWNVVALDNLAQGPAKDGRPDAGTVDEDVPKDDADSGAEENPEPSDELAEIKRILKKEHKTLEEYLAVGGLPGRLVFRQKTIVAALAAMVCDLENARDEPGREETTTQPELPVFKNNDQRKAWLGAYKDWGLWYRDGNIGVEYYKYDFDNGARLVAEVYREEATEYHGAYESCFLHLVGGPEPPKGPYGVGKWARHKNYCKHPNSETELVEFLKEMQKKGR